MGRVMTERELRMEGFEELWFNRITRMKDKEGQRGEVVEVKVCR